MMRLIGTISFLLFVFVLLFVGSRAAGAQGEGNWGTVKGRIVWSSKEIPQRMPIDLKNNPDKNYCLKDGPVLDEQWVVNPKNKGIRWTFVWLGPMDPKDKSPLPIHPALKDLQQKEVVIDQPICMFMPHALALREGQALVVKNSATIPHNFKYTGNPLTKNSGDNFLLPPKTSRVLDHFVADRLPIKVECNVHTWMNGWIRVFNHPYHAVTDEDGRFEFKNAPAGDFRLMVWHGSTGWRGGAKGKNGEPVTIKAGSDTDLGNLEMAPN